MLPGEIEEKSNAGLPWAICSSASSLPGAKRLCSFGTGWGDKGQLQDIWPWEEWVGAMAGSGVHRSPRSGPKVIEPSKQGKSPVCCRYRNFLETDNKGRQCLTVGAEPSQQQTHVEMKRAGFRLGWQCWAAVAVELLWPIHLAGIGLPCSMHCLVVVAQQSSRWVSP